MKNSENEKKSNRYIKNFVANELKFEFQFCIKKL